MAPEFFEKCRVFHYKNWIGVYIHASSISFHVLVAIWVVPSGKNLKSKMSDSILENKKRFVLFYIQFWSKLSSAFPQKCIVSEFEIIEYKIHL